ncbi:MAG: hypothetical protein IKU86_03685 [Thermoguttaceae bacterium]|nr:hypothetical protein [Thermoguttaceae bacterium]
MKTRLLFALKYAFFAFIAFTVPKIIVDSGRLVAPLERSTTPTRNAAPPKKRSFWPFRFLQASDAPPPSAETPLAAGSPGNAEFNRFDRFAAPKRADYAGRNGFNDVAPPETGAAFGDERSLSPSSFAPSGDAPFYAPEPSGGSPLSFLDFERASSYPPDSFARFAESEFAPSRSASSFGADATPFAPSTPRLFEELFRFGRSPAWLVENWPRVDAVAAEDGLVGYRVAVSTGAENDDLVGVYAAYFDATSERRIEFSGQTGDYRKILRFLQREYGVSLSPRSSAERFVYESTLSNGRGGATPGRLVVRPSRVFLRGAEKSFFEVDVVLERPYNR